MFKILLDNEIYHKEVSYSYHLKRLFIKKTHVKQLQTVFKSKFELQITSITCTFTNIKNTLRKPEKILEKIWQ